MNLIILMIPMALILGLLFLGAFIWTVKSGQMDELESPAARLLLEDLEQDKIKNKERV